MISFKAHTTLGQGSFYLSILQKNFLKRGLNIQPCENIHSILPIFPTFSVTQVVPSLITNDYISKVL